MPECLRAPVPAYPRACVFACLHAFMLVSFRAGVLAYVRMCVYAHVCVRVRPCVLACVGVSVGQCGD
eukprot:11095417-Alexandrium_andersonii.AAC.1